MLEIQKELDQTTLAITIAGRLDTDTAPQLNKEVEGLAPEVTTLKLDVAGLTYVSSAGLRSLLIAARTMDDREGSFCLENVPDIIRETLEITGLTGAVGL